MRPNFSCKINLSLLFLTLFVLLSAYSLPLNATIRYVSHTGSSTPPYTTWETAADSIQKCIEYCVDGDTIIVANGVYYESLVVNKYLWLIGSSIDSTVIDGTGLADPTVNFQSDGFISYFTIKGKGEGTNFTTCIRSNLTNIRIEFCRIMAAYTGIALIWSSSIIDQCILVSIRQGIDLLCDPDTCNSIIKNSLIFLQNSTTFRDAVLVDGGNSIISSNILIDGINSISEKGIQSGLVLNASNIVVTNNIVSGFDRNIDGYATDTAMVHNNTLSYAIQRGVTIGAKTDMRNNIIAHNNFGTIGPSTTNSDYNLYWQNNTHTTGGLAPNDLIADPMFVNDTIPIYNGTYDYHLQMFSPAIDAGDPNILDVDGSRSDIGAYGGPGGESYVYLDLPPRPPVNVSATVDTSIITVKWNKNTEADTSHYNVYRDTISNFTIDPSKLISSQTDTIYIQLNPQNVESLYYKITAVDNQGNESLPSEEVGVLITSVDDYQVVVEDYILYQNYPNPFNPSTKIGYKLKERVYVKLIIYDIKGELVTVLVNEVKEAGYYEVEFIAEIGNRQSAVGKQLASGIYLYRIEVIGEGNIPRFSDMKKMILIK